MKPLWLLMTALSAAAIATPAVADDTTDTGLLTALGITAATGKTSLGDDAGAIEAALYSGDAFQNAGAMIAQLVGARRSGRPVLILARGETVDLLTPKILSDEVGRLTALVEVVCAPPKPTGGKKGGGPKSLINPYSADLGETAPEAATEAAAGPHLRIADLVGAASTDTAIGGLTLTVDDRALINAVLMNGPGLGGGWTAWSPGQRLTAPSARGAAQSAFFLPGEAAGMPIGSDGLYKDYQKLVATMSAKRPVCAATDAGKAAIGSADSFVTGLNSSDKGPAPLAVAIAADAFRALNPLILRLTVEQSGGTSMTRSGLLYTLGLPNAATVGAGLLASYRLLDPSFGTLISVGVVRCAVRQTNIKRVADHLQHTPHRLSITQPYPLADTVCDYRVSG